MNILLINIKEINILHRTTVYISILKGILICVRVSLSIRILGIIIIVVPGGSDAHLHTCR